MKYLIPIVAVISLSLLSCGASGAIFKSDDKYSSMPCIEPFETGLIKIDTPAENKKSVPSYRVKLKGLVETNTSGDVYIVVNPESKSRKSYLVTGELKEQVAAMKGKYVTVICCYLERRYWSGTIRVYEILK